MEVFHFINFISSVFDTHIYEVLFILLFIEEAGIPLPVSGDIYTFLAGYQVIKHRANPFFIVLDVTVASVLGASFLFLLVSYKGEPLVLKYGKYILITPEKLEKGKSWFAKYGEAVILFGRWVPGLRIVLTIVAGLFQLNFAKFLIAITISTIVWSTAFLYAGITYGKQHTAILRFFRHYNISTTYLAYAAVTILSLFAIYLVLKRYTIRKSK